MPKNNLNPEIVWKHYKIAEDYKNSAVEVEVCAKKYNVEKSQIWHWCYRVYFIEKIDPKKYAELMQRAQKCIAEDISPATMSVLSKIPRSTINNAIQHLFYKEIIEKIKSGIIKIEEENMNFVPVERKIHPELMPPVSHQIAAAKQEIIKARNDIELSIGNGVKVILNPEFDATKIIKIIEFLKEL